MTCPKCHGSLRTVNKAGVRLEQCENCRGIFLDHGELEQILQAEQRYYGSEASYLPPGGGYSGHSGPPGHRGHPDSPRPYRDSPRPYRGEHGHHGHQGHYKDSPRPYGHKRGRGSFLGDLFG